MNTQQKTVDVGAVIDSASYFWVPFGISIMMIIIMLTDGFDLFTMGYVGPHLIRDWGISRTQLGPINSAGLIGMAIGSVALGWLGDRIGRKRAYVTCLAFLFAGSMLCYYAHDVWELTAWRLVTGLGLGGVTPLATTLISEWTSKKVRSVVVACVIVSVPLGGALAGIVERNVIPQYGWRAMFLIGAIVPLVLFALFSYLLPESPKYLAQHPTEHPRLAWALNRLLGE
jgi:AAHS family 4-hydroxybenzoate transporter-like MFS transporter